MSQPGAGGLADRRALITGATGGQGRAVALCLAREGAEVAITDLSPEALERLSEELRGVGAKVIARVADVRDESQVKSVIDATVSALGGLDILYNNAAVYLTEHDAPVHELALEVWEDVIRVNTTGVFLFCKHAVPHLLRSGSGVILNVSSVAGYAGDAEAHAYSASKGALIALTHSIAKRYGHAGLRANVLCPGFIDTPMVSFLLEDEDALQPVVAATALGRVGRPEEVAEVAAFLASDAASFVSSSVIPVHGGLVK